MSIKVFGVGKAVSELNHIIREKRKLVLAGMKEAGLLVQRNAQKRVPVEQGKLRASAYTRNAMDRSFGVEVGFSAEYALWVHENIEVNAGKKRSSGRGVYWGPAGEPKFLEKAFNDIKPEIPEIIARRLRNG